MCDPSFMFIDMVKVYGVNLTTIGSGGVGSMAVPIFAMGNRRLITRHTDFFFHDLGFHPEKEERLSVSELERKSENLMVSQKWYAEILEERTQGKFKAEEVLRLMKQESYLYPDDLLRVGLAHEVI
jgi:ATP-dependent protease ClpP protease subunit